MKTERKATVWDRVRATANLHGAAIDEQIDLFVAGGYKSKFSAAKYIKGYELSAPVVKLIGEFYRPHLAELREAEAETDPELRECYRCNDRELKRYIEFMESIVAACDAAVEKAVTQRKPRARKIKPPEVVTLHLKCRPEFPELGLNGVPVASIIDSQEAWFYDTEKRRLVRYVAKDRDGLGVKGTTILNYDEKNSGIRPVRKPAEFFNEHKPGARAFNRAWTMIRGKISPVKSRTNENMVLLAVG